MPIIYHEELEQGTPEWLQARLGLLTASEMKLALTPKLKIANNDKTRAHIYELAAQRISNYVEPHYVSDDMMRGTYDEIKAKEVYTEKYGPLTDVGFITNDNHGVNIGFSPDALIGDDGIIEIKSRRYKFQVETITNDEVPEEYMLQIQTGLLVSGRKYCDFVSYAAGLPMFKKRVEPDEEYFEKIIEASLGFEDKINETIEKYHANVKKNDFVNTEREEFEEGEITV